MFITFRTFRKILLGTIFLLSTASLVLSIYLRPFLIHPNSSYVLVGILDCLIFATVLALSKPLFGCRQSVATETMGGFILLPFALILTLFVISLSVTPDPTAICIFAILQILIFIGTILHGLYTICLIFTSMLTVCAFDRDVWSRDIGSSPSPFPMAFLFGFVCPCFSDRPDPTLFEDVHQESACLPGCNCSIAKAQIPNTSESGPGLEPIPSARMVAGLSSRSLVRVPNDVERRTSIAIAFEIV
ncbi:hypothetical protein B0H19DRAFT_27159 [Mycena capillaripes]|nr:hypothetical protein B0H19DRAFT_27159 [Mycena capillaripes]